MTIPTFPASGAGFPSVEANIPSFPTSVAALNPYWPFSDIALPFFLWRPDLTGDYRNVGSAGAALDLSAGGSGNSFNNGLLLDGNGWVVSPYNPDISNIGSLFSFISKGIIVFSGSAGQAIVSGFG